MIEDAEKALEKNETTGESLNDIEVDEEAEETKKAAVVVTGDEFGEYEDIKDLRKKPLSIIKRIFKEHR
ncbi:MAG: hypothetical protein IJ728_07960 [Selenomonadaceae bacterium]|nr:hypothetical protein [Selenomonadaceae bacterium]